MSLPPILSSSFAFWIAFLLGALVCLRADVRRRRLSFAGSAGWNLSVALDIFSSVTSSGALAGFLVFLASISLPQKAIPLASPVTFGALAWAIVLLFLWSEGRRQVQFQ